MHPVGVKEAIHPIHRLGREVVAQYGTVSLLDGHTILRQKVGQSQSLFLWRYMWSFEEQAVQASAASSSTTTVRSIVFFIGICLFLPV